MSFFKSIGKALKGVGKTVGGAMKFAAPFAGLIPGVGPLAAAGLGAGGNLLGRALSGQKTFGDLGQTAMSAGAGAGGAALSGGNSFAGLGKALSQPNLLGNAAGKIDLSKAIGAGAAGLNVAGGIAQRKANQNAMNANTNLRNQLMSRILGGSQQTYNFMPEPGY